MAPVVLDIGNPAKVPDWILGAPPASATAPIAAGVTRVELAAVTKPLPSTTKVGI